MFHMMQPELAIYKTRETKKFTPNDGKTQYPAVLTAVNGLRSDKIGASKYDIMDDYEYAGIVQGSVKINGLDFETPMISITSGGLTPMYNTSVHMIYAGDLVAWTFPDKDANGRPTRLQRPHGMEKTPIIIEVVKPETRGREMAQRLNELARLSPAERKNKPASLIALQSAVANFDANGATETDLANFFAAIFAGDLMSRRIIGRFVTNTAPGQKGAMIQGSMQY